MTGLAVGALAATIVAATWIAWFRLLNQVRVPRERGTYLALNGLGATVGVLAFAADPGLVGGILAGVAVLGGVAFIGLRLQSPQPKLTPAVAVGEAVLDFTAADDEGRRFELASLRGKPFLLKFFRGHW